jgi:hypothetical protein
MATYQQVINRSLRLIGALGAGATPPAEDTTDVLFALNAMLSSWRNEKLMVYALQDISVTLINGTASYTIGPSGAGTTATNPVKIESARVTKSDIDYPVELIDDKRYNAISQKTSTSDIPSYLYWNFSQGNGTAYVFPVPTEANTLKLSVWTPLSSVAAADTVTLPPGYEDAIAYNLAVRIAPEFEQNASETVIALARDTKASIKRVNHKPFESVTQIFGMFRANGRSDIIGGE